MSSKHLRGDVNYAWPSAEVAVMGAKVTAAAENDKCTASSSLDRYWCKHKINTEDFVIQKKRVVFVCDIAYSPFFLLFNFLIYILASKPVLIQ